MATLPITAQINPQNTALTLPPANNLMQGFSGVGIFRQVGLLLGLAASIAVGFAVVLWSQEPDYSPLLSNSQNIDVNQAVNILQAHDIPYTIDPRGGGLLVASEQLHLARMKLAAVGIANNSNVGFELLDKEQGLGTSQFMENISYRRGLEGELARTISSLQSIRSARIHLGLPKATVFVRDARKPSASVFVALMSGRSLTKEQVKAITNLVASSIPQLAAADVTIVDQSGHLLSNKGEDANSTIASHQLEYTQKLESVISGRVESILLPVVGVNKFRVQVSANIDFTALEETQEAYDPKQQVLRSEQTLEEERSGNANVGGVPGALSNQPPAEASVPEEAPEGGEATANNTTTKQNRRSQSIKNYELDRKISHTKYQQGQVRRLSVAVVVDNMVPVAGANADTALDGADPQTKPSVALIPWTQEDIDRLTNLVKGAVGFDQNRGDVVTVINAPFVIPKIQILEILEIPIWEKPWFMKLLKQGLAVLLVLLLVFVIIRPIMKSLANNGQQQKALAEATARAEEALKQAENTPTESPPNGMMQTENPTNNIGSSAPDMLLGHGVSEVSLPAIQNMIEGDPQRAAQVVKQWVKQNG